MGSAIEIHWKGVNRSLLSNQTTRLVAGDRE